MSDAVERRVERRRSEDKGRAARTGAPAVKAARAAWFLDFDGTLVATRIDFAAMRRAVADLLQRWQLDPVVHGMTDVTGFGLIGHAREMALASNVSLKINAAHVRLLDLPVERERRLVVVLQPHRRAEVDAKVEGVVGSKPQRCAHGYHA